jgi:hypothetical protein
VPATEGDEAHRAGCRVVGRIRTSPTLLDHLVGEQQHGVRDAQPERPRGLDLDHELKLSRLLNRQIARVCADLCSTRMLRVEYTILSTQTLQFASQRGRSV